MNILSNENLEYVHEMEEKEHASPSVTDYSNNGKLNPSTTWSTVETFELQVAHSRIYMTRYTRYKIGQNFTTITISEFHFLSELHFLKMIPQILHVFSSYFSLSSV